MAPKSQKGFTILELMIAISVFTVAIVLMTIGIIAIGRYYQQGATKAKLLTASREIQSEFTQAIQYSGISVDPQEQSGFQVDGSGTDYSYSCLGNIRFRWQLDVPNNFFVDNISNSSCEDNKSADFTISDPLPNGTVVTQFDIDGNNPYTLTTRFVIGDQQLFVNSNYSQQCQNDILGSEFCSVVSLSSTVARKVTD